MDTPTQPILCCLGETVAGCPTQFLMERAFGALGLDWRAITVEVEGNQFEVAAQGMAAMHFRALRLFPSLEEIAAQHFFKDPLDQFIGHATSAALLDGHWMAWNNTGSTILACLAQRSPLANCVVWLHGNTPRTRSTLVAIVRESTMPQAILCTAAEWTRESLPAQLAGLSNLHLCQSMESSSELLLNILQEANAEGEASDRAEIGMPVVLIADQLDAHDQHTLEESLASVGGSAIYACRLDEPNRVSEVLTDVDIAVAAEAFDFSRWTGHEVDVGLLRDAYDEYSDF
ncbi:MAG: hypothetical protein R3C53_08135 [Pirellulaceae bacterium]